MLRLVLCIDISGWDPLYLADKVFDLTRYFPVRGVRMVVITEIFFSRHLVIGRRDPRVAPNFNERVVAYNLRLRELTQSTTSTELWRHRVMWANWVNLLVDGLHFTDGGHRRYFRRYCSAFRSRVRCGCRARAGRMPRVRLSRAACVGLSIGCGWFMGTPQCVSATRGAPQIVGGFVW